MAEVSAKELASLFDCSLRTVTSLANEGIIKRTARGRYDGPASIRGYVRHLREAAAGRQPAAPVVPLGALAASLADDPGFDPRAVLQSIAADTTAPANARVQAARALIAAGCDVEGNTGAANDELMARTVRLLTKGRLQ